MQWSLNAAPVKDTAVISKLSAISGKVAVSQSHLEPESKFLCFVHSPLCLAAAKINGPTVIFGERLSEPEEVFLLFVTALIIQVDKAFYAVGKDMEALLPVPHHGGAVRLPIILLLWIDKHVF